MSGKMKLNISVLCASALALYFASTAGDTSPARLVYTAFGLSCLTAAVFMSLFNKKLLLGAAAAAVAVLYGLFIYRDFTKIEMERVIPEDAVVESVGIDGRTEDDEPFMYFWRPDGGGLRINYMYDNTFDIRGGAVDFESLRTATFYSHWIPNPSPHFSSWFDRLDVTFKCPDGKRVAVTIYDNYDFDGGWSLYIDDYSGKSPYHNSDRKSYEVLTAADLSSLIPDSVAQFVIRGDKPMTIPSAEEQLSRYSVTRRAEDHDGEATLETRLERLDDGGLSLNSTIKSEWRGVDTPDSMTLTAEARALLEEGGEPVLLESLTKEGEGVKARFFNLHEQVFDGPGDPILIEVSLKATFTLGDKTYTVTDAVRYER